MVSLSLHESPTSSGLRPVNLRTDLVPLADLIELAFADTMDSSGRAAVREMRSLSHLGPGLSVLLGMNDLAQGVGLGFVWIENGRLVGNTSIYPANLPGGSTWIIANVAVHPDYRGRGIARQLVQASLDMIRRRSRSRQVSAVLQVEADNAVAFHLYQRLGFVAGTLVDAVAAQQHDAHALALQRSVDLHHAPPPQRMARRIPDGAAPAPRRAGRDGLAAPAAPGVCFAARCWKRLSDIVSMRSLERLVIRGEHDDLRAVMWIESGFAASSVQLTLMVEPELSGQYTTRR